MITVPELVEGIVKRSPYLEEALQQDLINLSSLARKIQPEIQQRLLKDIQVGAIVMALKRLQISLVTTHHDVDVILQKITDITVRSNLVEYTYTNSSTLVSNHSKLFQEASLHKNSFLTITHGVFETSIFASKSLENVIEETFKQEELRSTFKDLSSLTLVLPKEAVYIPGVYYSILKILAWEGINFVEVVSNYTELTIIMESKNVDKAFSVLKNY